LHAAKSAAKNSVQIEQRVNQAPELAMLAKSSPEWAFLELQNLLGLKHLKQWKISAVKYSPKPQAEVAERPQFPAVTNSQVLNQELELAKVLDLPTQQSDLLDLALHHA
jgi:hypothetical protein